jgi:hypothetical protein
MTALPLQTSQTGSNRLPIIAPSSNEHLTAAEAATEARATRTSPDVISEASTQPTNPNGRAKSTACNQALPLDKSWGQRQHRKNKTNSLLQCQNKFLIYGGTASSDVWAF